MAINELTKPAVEEARTDILCSGSMQKKKITFLFFLTMSHRSSTVFFGIIIGGISFLELPQTPQDDTPFLRNFICKFFVFIKNICSVFNRIHKCILFDNVIVR